VFKCTFCRLYCKNREEISAETETKRDFSRNTIRELSFKLFNSLFKWLSLYFNKNVFILLLCIFMFCNTCSICDHVIFINNISTVFLNDFLRIICHLSILALLFLSFYDTSPYVRLWDCYSQLTRLYSFFLSSYHF
jgi:hypothetical protein